MTLPGKYPQANQSAQPRPNLAGGGTFDHVEKLCLHTTETTGWPGYPTFAPHLTYNPWTHVWHQHYPLTKSATTLADPSSTKLRENRDNVIQVEIVAYCDPKRNKPGTGIDYLDDQAVRDLADLAAWLHKNGGLELALAPTWLPYPSSYGKSRARMSDVTFDAFRGIHGHEHASGNDHGDPGAPPWLDDLLRYAQQAAGQSTTPSIPTIGKGLDMAAAKDIYFNPPAGQVLKAGLTSIALDAKPNPTDPTLSIATGPSAGVDVLATLVVTDAAGARVPVEAFFRVVSYKKGTDTTTLADRAPTIGDQVSFKGALAEQKDGRSARLRLIVNAPVDGLVVKTAQVSGWAL